MDCGISVNIPFNFGLLAFHVIIMCWNSSPVHGTPRPIRIAEGTAAGTVLIPNLFEFLGRQADLRATDTETTTILTIGNAAVPGVNWFMIDDKRRSLVVKTPPDRDALCPTESILPETAVSMEGGGIEFPYRNKISQTETEQCIVKISVLHGSPTNPYFDVIPIVIEDINDNAPIFFTETKHASVITPFEIKIPEKNGIRREESDIIDRLVEAPFQIALPQARDADTGGNDVCGYRLEGQDAHLFRLETSPTLQQTSSAERNAHFGTVKRQILGSVSQIWLVPATGRFVGTSQALMELDREHKDVYKFVLVAYDCGTPQRTGRISIHLVIEDVNDHAPVFTQERYIGTLAENENAGHVILDFAAYDLDQDLHNGKVSFRIPGDKRDQASEQRFSLPKNQQIAAQLFDIDQFPERATSYNGHVTSETRNLTKGRLILRLQPKEELNELLKHAKLLARQNAVRPNIPGDTSFEKHRLGSDPSGSLLQFTLEAYDHGHPKSLSTHVPIYITIKNVNSKPPTIFISYLQPALGISHSDSSSVLGWGRVKENTAPSMVAQVTVLDEDDVLGQLDVACSADDQRFKLIDLAQSSHELMLNDRAVTNSSGSLGTVHIRDRRSVSLMRVYKLMLNIPLDREASNQKPAREEFTLVCVDNSKGHLPGGQLSSKAMIRLLIDDMNDNAPVFEQERYIFHVMENKPSLEAQLGMKHNEPGRYVIGSVHANDADEGVHAAIEYKLAPNPGTSIEIDSSTGQLFASRPFDREVIDEVALRVLAIDCQGSDITDTKRLTGTTEVRIHIDDVNDSPPIFQEMNYHFEVEEGLDLLKVGQVSAKDADLGEAARIMYRLSAGKPSKSTVVGVPVFKLEGELEITNHFQIDPINGILRLKTRLDRERKSHYEFYVLAIDNPTARPLNIERTRQADVGTTVQFTATATVLVTVLDRNDCTPNVLSPRNREEFVLGPDQMIAGNTIFTIRAEDPDLGENGTVEYELIQVEGIAGTWNFIQDIENNTIADATVTKRTRPIVLNEPTDSIPFALDRTAGICYLRENLTPLNDHASLSYLIHIRAYDLGRPISLNTTLVVRVTRQPAGSIASTAEFADVGLSDAQLLSRLDNNGLGADSRAKLGTWATSGSARMSDRSMVVILSAVFVLLLLTAVVLLLLVRYRRLFTRNNWITDSSPGARSLNKQKVHMTSDNTLGAKRFINGAHGLYPEVVAAPWVNNASSPIDSANTLACPAFYNIDTGTHRKPGGSCIKNPGACWSPHPTVRCFSPMTHHSPLAEVHPNRHFLSGLYKYSAADMELVTRNQLSNKNYEPVQVQNIDHDPSSDVVFENFGAERNTVECDILTMDNEGRSRDFEESKYYKLNTINVRHLPFGLWQRSMQESQNSQIDAIPLNMSRHALSLEDLTMKVGPCSVEECDVYQSLLTKADTRRTYEVENEATHQTLDKVPSNGIFTTERETRHQSPIHVPHTRKSHRSSGNQMPPKRGLDTKMSKTRAGVSSGASNKVTQFYRNNHSATGINTYRTTTKGTRKPNLFLRFAQQTELTGESSRETPLSDQIPHSTGAPDLAILTSNQSPRSTDEKSSSVPGSPNKHKTDVCVLGSFV